MKKPRVIAETGAGMHGVATATVAARYGMECVVYMGVEDVKRQAAERVPHGRARREGGRRSSRARSTLKDALNEAMRDWVTNVDTTFYIIGTVAGPHPYPMMVRDFQSVIGEESIVQMQELAGRQPDAVIACVGGGSNAMGIFYPYIKHESTRLVGVEAAGEGLETGKHAASLCAGKPGVLHGNRTYLLQDANGQITETHSVSAGLDYPGRRPGARLAEGQQARRIRGGDRRRGAGRVPRAVPQRGHHPGARIRARRRAGDEDGAVDAEGRDPARQSLRPRRQGHAHRRRALGEEALMSRIQGRFEALAQAQAQGASSRTSPPAIRIRRSPCR